MQVEKVKFEELLNYKRELYLTVIKNKIKDKGYTQEAFANLMGMSRGALIQILKGNPTLETIIKISMLLDIDVYDFFCGSLKSDGLSCPHCGKPLKIRIE